MRRLIAALFAVVLLASSAVAQTDPLPSWNDGAAKQAIINFVKATTDPASSELVPEKDRVAAFDQDGTLWVEHPVYSFLVYALDKVPALVSAKPGLAGIEPFKTILTGDKEAIAKLSDAGLEKLLGAIFSGMTVDQFSAEVSSWIQQAKDARWKRPYTDLTYLPMQEVLKYLRANSYRTYIVTGGGQDFVRTYVDSRREWF